MKHYMKTILYGLLAVSLSLLPAGCEKNNRPDIPDGEEGTGTDDSWVLVWSDEFDAPTPDGRPNPLNWSYDLGNSGFGNAELQNYTDRVENASYVTLGDSIGCLRIAALRDYYDGIEYSSARINTAGKYEFCYGRFEARLMLPYGPGLWPAFWLLGGDYETNTWPACGEIDIMENKGYQPNIVSCALHMPGYSGGNPITTTFGYEDRRFDTDFHIFAVEWDEEKIEFSVDGVTYQSVTREDAPDGQWVFDHPFFIILNVAVGGNFGGNPTDGTYFPQYMYIDYVRVWQKPEHIDPEANRGETEFSGPIDDWNDSDSDKGLNILDRVKK